ncbi:MAG: hypothetical protein ACJAVK_000398 [Akkermansiaceae bacterium]|jgi:hypothetical protein
MHDSLRASPKFPFQSMKWRPVLIVSVLSWSVAQAANYQNTVIRLAPTYYYELNETLTESGAIDTMGNAVAPGVFNGDYVGGGPMVGTPGPLVVYGDVSLAGLGGAENLAHSSNNAGHITLGDGNLYASPAITVSLFLKAGTAQGGDRIFTNNVVDATKSFQIVTANNGLVLAVDPGNSGEIAERTLYLEDNSEPDRRFIDPEAGWFHIVASTEGATGPERAANFKLWVNGIDRTANLQPDSTGWGTDTGMAKIGGRRATATDSTTHSGSQDEVAIWLNRVLTDDEVAELWQSAISEKIVPLKFTHIENLEIEGVPSVTVIWQSKPGKNYEIYSSTDLEIWNEITDNHPSGGDSTSFTDSPISEDSTRVFYRVQEVR